MNVPDMRDLACAVSSQTRGEKEFHSSADAPVVTLKTSVDLDIYYVTAISQSTHGVVVTGHSFPCLLIPTGSNLPLSFKNKAYVRTRIKRTAGNNHSKGDRHNKCFKGVPTFPQKLTIYHPSFAACQGAFRQDLAAQEGQRDRLLAEDHLWGVPYYQQAEEGLQDEVEEDHQAHQSWAEGREDHRAQHWGERAVHPGEMEACLEIQVEGGPFQEGPGKEGHLGDPLLLVAVVGGRQVRCPVGKVDEEILEPRHNQVD